MISRGMHTRLDQSQRSQGTLGDSAINLVHLNKSWEMINVWLCYIQVQFVPLGKLVCMSRKQLPVCCLSSFVFSFRFFINLGSYLFPQSVADIF